MSQQPPMADRGVSVRRLSDEGAEHFIDECAGVFAQRRGATARGPKNPADPAIKQITIGGPTCSAERQPRPQRPKCLVKLTLERGAAAVSVMDNRFGTDTCATARKLATLIAERAS